MFIFSSSALYCSFNIGRKRNFGAAREMAAQRTAHSTNTQPGLNLSWDMQSFTSRPTPFQPSCCATFLNLQLPLHESQNLPLFQNNRVSLFFFSLSLLTSWFFFLTIRNVRASVFSASLPFCFLCSNSHAAFSTVLCCVYEYISTAVWLSHKARFRNLYCGDGNVSRLLQGQCLVLHRLWTCSIYMHDECK